jgi:hypothetical protein
VPSENHEESLEFIDGELGDEHFWTSGGAAKPGIQTGTGEALSRALGLEPVPPRVLSDTAEILVNTHCFYTNLYRRYGAQVKCQWYCLSQLAACTRCISKPDAERISSLIIADEVAYAVEHLKKGKAAGPDGICAELLCDCPPEWGELLSRQHNACYLDPRTSLLSEKERQGRLSVLYKKGDRQQIGNFRPVA